mmetsp:Transcript_929/g.1291  ORF Transcript_929/g.1291 Transcript_929/m.1291 type:complete len:106 (-) Transcript_929:205-522(-)
MERNGPCMSDYHSNRLSSYVRPTSYLRHPGTAAHYRPFESSTSTGATMVLFEKQVQNGEESSTAPSQPKPSFPHAALQRIIGVQQGLPHLSHESKQPHRLSRGAR